MKNVFPPQSELLTRKQAAEYLGVNEGTLAVWACTGRYHLRMVKIGRLVKYRLSDLVAFIETNLTVAEVA
jgi:excisionase family DNA binding protein